MNTSKFLLSTFVGGIVYFLLGWLVYGVILTNMYPASENVCFLFYFLGSLSFSALLAYVFNKWAGISNWASGAKAGAFLAFLIALYVNFFMYANAAEINYQNMIIDVVAGALMGAITGAVIAMLSGDKVKE